MPQPRDERQENNERFTRKDAFSWSLWLMEVFQVVTLPFLRVGAGVSQPGMEALVMAVAMPNSAIVKHSLLLWRYWQFWLVALEIFRLTKRRDTHSWFVGRSWLVGMFVKNHALASVIEAGLVTGGGYLVEDFGLRCLLMASGMAWLAFFVVHRSLAEKERIAFNNARHEMNAYTDRVR